jgi:phytoene dehydrogenase-like protein
MDGSEGEATNVADVVVVGGGLGGLATAALLARTGLGVTLLERASELGGRAGTHAQDGFFFNEGAHALYRGGAAARVLQGLGVRWSGKQPPAAGLAVLGGRAHTMPVALGSLLVTGLTGWSGKLQGARVMARLAAIDTAALQGVSWGEWVERAVPDPALRAALEMFVRVSTYANAPAIASAGATIDQLRLARRPGVEYVDGGWQTLVASLTGIAVEAGVRVQSRARVTCAARAPGERGWRVSLEDGAPVLGRALVLATGPATARSVVASGELAAWASRCVPAKAACLDVGLARLPDARATFALGVDRPLYLSVHSKSARVAPEGAALVSTMKYLAPGQPADPGRDRAELEAWLDLLQPGWRDQVVARRFLPGMVATNAIVTASGGGASGRPGPRVPDAAGVFVVGDWIGGEGMLLDASLASAERAAREIVADLARTRGLPDRSDLAKVA